MILSLYCQLYLWNCILIDKKILLEKVCFCKYAQLNMKMSSHAQPYDGLISMFLQVRTHDFIKRCIDNMELAIAIERITVVSTFSL